jgi:hypothetical protein
MNTLCEKPNPLDSGSVVMEYGSNVNEITFFVGNDIELLDMALITSVGYVRM